MRDKTAAFVFLSIGSLATVASAQDGWQEYRDPYGTFTVACPGAWRVSQKRPGEVEVKEAPHTWVKISVLATAPGEGASAYEEIISYMYTFPERPKRWSFSQLSLHPDRAVWAYEIPDPKEGTLKGLLAVEVNGILHYGVAYQAPLRQWERKRDTFKRIAASIRFGQFAIPEWIYGGQRGPLPRIVRSRLRRRWSTDRKGILSAGMPEGWEGKGGDRRLEFSQTGGPSRMMWRVSALTGEKEPPARLVAAAVGVKSIDAVGMKEQRTTAARLFPRPKKPRPPTKERKQDANERYYSINRMLVAFQDPRGVKKQGYALVILYWTKKKPQPTSADVLVFWTDRDRFGRELRAMEEIAASAYGLYGEWGEWEGSTARRDLKSLMSDYRE